MFFFFRPAETRRKRTKKIYLSLRDEQHRVRRLDGLELVCRVGGAENGVAVGGALDHDAEFFFERERGRERVVSFFLRSRSRKKNKKKKDDDEFVFFFPLAYLFLCALESTIHVPLVVHQAREEAQKRIVVAKGERRHGLVFLFFLFFRKNDALVFFHLSHRRKQRFAQFNQHSPVPQHLAQHAFVQLEQHARLRDASDDEVAALGMRSEQSHFFLFPLSSVNDVDDDDEEQLLEGLG